MKHVFAPKRMMKRNLSKFSVHADCGNFDCRKCKQPGVGG